MFRLPPISTALMAGTFWISVEANTMANVLFLLWRNSHQIWRNCLPVICGELLVKEAMDSLTPIELPQQHCSLCFCFLLSAPQTPIWINCPPSVWSLTTSVYIQISLLKQPWASSASIVLFSIVIWSFVLQFIATPFSSWRQIVIIARCPFK